MRRRRHQHEDRDGRKVLDGAGAAIRAGRGDRASGRAGARPRPPVRLVPPPHLHTRSVDTSASSGAAGYPGRYGLDPRS